MTNLQHDLSTVDGIRDRSSEAVRRSFELGWHMADLYVAPQHGADALGLSHGPDLPGLRKLSATTLVELGLDQVEADLAALGRLLTSRDVALPSSASPSGRLASEPPPQAREGVYEFHVEVISWLIAADYRCAKAYNLGHGLAEVCAASQSAALLSEHLTDQAPRLIGWITDLKTLLPDHAAEAVSRSLEQWLEWANGNFPAAFDWRHAAMTSRVLHTQGQRWRALLSGEKAATDVLTASDYVTAASTALRHAGSIVRKGAAAFWPFLLVTLALFGGGIGLTVGASGAVRVLAGLGLIAASIWIASRAVVAPLRGFAVRLDDPIWRSALDEVIAERVQLPFPRIARPAREQFEFSASSEDTTTIVHAADLTTSNPRIVTR